MRLISPFLTPSPPALYPIHVFSRVYLHTSPILYRASTGLAYWGRFNASNPETLPIPLLGAFQPAGGRAWLVKFWELPSKWVGIAFPFGFVLWVLFFFDHNVSVSLNILSSHYLVGHRLSSFFFPKTSHVPSPTRISERYVFFIRSRS